MQEFDYPGLLEKLKSHPANTANQCFSLTAGDAGEISVYPNSIRQAGEVFYFIGRNAAGKALWVAGAADRDNSPAKLEAQLVCKSKEGVLWRCPLSNHNAGIVRKIFSWTRPRCIGAGHSFGYGDRLGIANPAHVRAAATSPMKAVFAQQSIRELERTERQPEDVIDAATWAVFQEGYQAGWGADADHLKTTDHIDRMMQAGFTMFTIDPGAEVIDAADLLPIEAVTRRIAEKIPRDLGASVNDFLSKYVDQKFCIAENFVLQPEKEAVLRCLLKYSGVVAKTVFLWRYIAENYADRPVEIELSIDETESVTSAFEHFFISNELQKRGVKLMSLAPRFIGRFEKGVDYIGEIDVFMDEYKKHQLIAQKTGGYKIGFHSGSDKFQVYQAAAKLGIGSVHVKTAGTSYLEALRTIAEVEPGLFRKILDFCRNLYEVEKRTYHVSAQLQNVPAAADCSDARLMTLLDDDDALQVLHVTYRRVLTEKSVNG